MIDGETILLLNAYFDGELSPSETLAIERRLASEPELCAYLESLGGLSGNLKAIFSEEPGADETLRARVVNAVGFSEDVSGVVSRSYSWMAIAASLLIGLALGSWLAGPLSPWPIPRDPSVSDMIFAAHLRGLAAAQPFDIASSDRHVVKPWFNGRTTIAPMAPDLAGDGFPLVGGRIDIVRDEAVPTLVYKHDRHVISVTVIASRSDVRDGEELRDGTTIIRWAAGSLTYIAVSDVNTGDLHRFVDLFRASS